jgi:2-dehydro-3-deoxyphosphogluconate aldolase/(4S)-4-hydroxy-2-oxoglutarate aldolase
MPTGGVDLTTVGAFLKAGAVMLGAGAALVDGAAVQKGDWATLTKLACAFRDEVRKARS